MSTPQLTRYGGWSRAKGPLLFGLTGPAAIAVLAGGIPTLLAVGVQNWAALLVTVPSWVIEVVLVVVPVRGRPAVRWLIDWMLVKVGAMRGWTRFQSRVAAGIATEAHEADLPGVLSGIRTHDGPPYGPLMARPALIADAAARTWAVTARIEHPGIGVASADKRAGQARGLGDMLEGIADTDLISTVALTVRSVPDDGTERAMWERDHRSTRAPQLATRVNAELAAGLTLACVRIESFVTIVVPEDRIKRHAKDAGGGIDGRARVMYTLMNDIESRLLGGIGCTTVTWLDSPALAEAIRTGFAPGDRGILVSAGMDGQQYPGAATTLPMAAAGPTEAAPPEARHYEHDAWCSVSFALALPDKGALMGALAPIVTPSTPGERRCLTVFYEAIGRQRADRAVGRESMKNDLVLEMRERGGFKNRASQRRDQERIQARDENLAYGHALVRHAAVAAVTVPSVWPVSQYSRDLHSSITRSGFTGLRLDLAQDAGFAAACIPVGIGMPTYRRL